jgi:hypothetical protein
MNANLLNAVKQITAGYGEGVLADPRRLNAFFADLAKDEPRPPRLAFGRCIEAGAYDALKAAPDAAGRVSRKAAITQKLRDEQGLDTAFCTEALDILEAALYGTAGAAAQPAPQQPLPAPARPAPRPETVRPAYAAPSTAPVLGKKHTLRNVLIGILIGIGLNYSAAEYNLPIIVGLPCVGGAAGDFLLLKWKKAGFRVVFISAILAFAFIFLRFFISMGNSLYPAIITAIAMMVILDPIGIGILYGVLKLRNSMGKSAWEQLE